jgi:putative membrane protein
MASMLRITLAAFHLIALGLGLGAVLRRGSTLREPLTTDALRRAFSADALWGIAAALWIVTGVWRMAAGIEKPREYYEMKYFFIAKMVMLLVILALEIMPMITLIKWRRELRAGGDPGMFASVLKARRIATISHVQALLVVLMVFAAVTMARGYGLS